MVPRDCRSLWPVPVLLASAVLAWSLWGFLETRSPVVRLYCTDSVPEVFYPVASWRRAGMGADADEALQQAQVRGAQSVFRTEREQTAWALDCHGQLRAHLPAEFQASYRPADEVLPRLWLGNECAAAHARFLREQNVTLVITMSAEHNQPGALPELPAGTAHVMLGLSDNNNGGNAALIEARLNAAAEALYEHLRFGRGAVLVHCQMGISRSAAAVVGYLMSRQRWKGTADYDAALAHVRAVRPVASPNAHFERVLRGWQ